MYEFNTIEEALADIQAGRMVVVVDDEDRENEGDLVMAAEKVAPEAVNFMASYGKGLICLPTTRDRLVELDIPMMTVHNSESMRTAFTVSVDAKTCTTGISAYERAMTIKAFLDPRTRPDDLVRPGHVFPLKAKQGGVLRRAGHTEAAVDLAKLAGLYPAGVICEIMDDDGTMARVPQLMTFAKRHGLKIMTIKDLIAYRSRHEQLVKRLATAELPTKLGDFKIVAYHNVVTDENPIALVKGDVSGNEDILVRMHSGCVTGDILGSLRCDCGDQLQAALSRINAEGQGVLVYFPEHEGRGIGLINKIKAYALQDEGQDTVEANESLGFPPDLRTYGTGAQVLVDLGVTTIRLLTNNPRKVVGLEGFGLEITDRLPLQVGANPKNAKYLQTKHDKLGHLLDPAFLAQAVQHNSVED